MREIKGHSAAWLLLAASLVAVALAGPASAQDAMKGMSMPSSPTPAKTGTGTGVIKAIDAKAGTVTLQHGPIPAIGWPAMAMVFKASPLVVLKGLKVGQTVDFDAKVRGVSAEVSAVRPK